MRALILIYFSGILLSPCFAQMESGLKKEEVRDMIAICNSFTFIDLYNSDSKILPSGYKKRYTSGVFGMDNKYQIYQKDNVAVINLRGSTAKKISWLENVHSGMIPAKGVINVNGEDVPYTFATDSAAAVHSGYALGIAFLSREIVYQINSLNREGIYDIIITGHSQGGALANMLRAYLENLPDNKISAKNNFKTYAFAAPKTGNKAFAEEYNTRFCSSNTSYNIVNAEDPIPTFPLSYDEKNSLTEQLKSLLADPQSFSFKKIMSDGMLPLIDGNLARTAKILTGHVTREISKDLGPVSMPDYVADINFSTIGNRIEINPLEYPKVLKDSAILKNDSLIATYQKDADGQFVNKELYAKPPWMWQHKPYNYYVSILKAYFPKEYTVLDKKYLSENL